MKVSILVAVANALTLGYSYYEKRFEIGKGAKAKPFWHKISLGITNYQDGWCRNALDGTERTFSAF